MPSLINKVPAGLTTPYDYEEVCFAFLPLRGEITAVLLHSERTRPHGFCECSVLKVFIPRFSLASERSNHTAN